MKIAVLGTGVVGRAHAVRLSELGHDVVMGTRDVEKKLAEDKPDQMGNPPFSTWQKKHTSVKLVAFPDAVAQAEMIFEALHGQIAIETLTILEKHLQGKVLVDISNPLDFSKGMPPTLFVCNTDSLGEQIQKILPETKVVKAFNTTNAMLQVNPLQLDEGDHHLFICGNDEGAKKQVADIAKSYGWKNIIDLGDISNARGMEIMLPMWLRIWNALQNPMFNFKVVTK